MDSAIGQILLAWERCVAHCKTEKRTNIDLALLCLLDGSVMALSTEAGERMQSMPTAYPPGINARLVVPADVAREANNLTAFVSSKRVLEAASAVTTLAKQCLDAGDELIIASAAAVTAWDVFSVTTCAIQWAQGSMRMGSGSPDKASSGATKKSPEQAVIDTLLLRICHLDVFSSGSALLDAARAASKTAAGGAGGPSAPRGRNGTPATCPVPAFLSHSCRVMRCLPSLLDRICQVLYYTTSSIYDEFDTRGVRTMDPLLTALAATLERSQILEAASAALLAVDPAESMTLLKADEGDFMDEVTRGMSYLANAMSLLARIAMDLAEVPSAGKEGGASAGAGASGSEGGAAATSEAARARLNGVSERLCQLLLAPSVQRLQAVLLEQFCVAGTVPPPPSPRDSAAAAGTVAGDSSKGGRTGSGRSTSSARTPTTASCGWPLMDALRLDRHMTGWHTAAASSPVPDGVGVLSSRAPPATQTELAPTLLTLCLPLLLTWAAAAAGHPSVQPLLPPGEAMERALARFLEGAVRLSRGQGEKEGWYDKVNSMQLLHPAVMLIIMCAPRYRSPARLAGEAAKRQAAKEAGDRPAGSVGSTSPTDAFVSTNPLTALDLAGWRVAAYLRLALELKRKAEQPSGDAAGCSAADGNGSGGCGNSLRRWRRWLLQLGRTHWLHWVWEAVQMLHKQSLTEGWTLLSPADKADAARRLVRADLLPSLDHCLRLFVAHVHPSLTYSLALTTIGITITQVYRRPLLRAVMEPATASPSPSTSSSPTPQIDLGLYVTVAKLSRRVAAELRTATEAAALVGFPPPPPGFFGDVDIEEWWQGDATGDVDTEGEDAGIRLTLLRITAGHCFNILTDLCCEVGPVGVVPGMPAASQRPEVQAVSELCVHATLGISHAFLDSLACEQRDARQRGRGCIFKSTSGDGGDGPSTSGLWQRLAWVLWFTPACLTSASIASSTAASSSRQPAAALLALAPEQLLTLCCELLPDMLNACKDEPASAGPSRGPRQCQSDPVLTFLAEYMGVQLPGQTMTCLIRAVGHLAVALFGLAARTDMAPHVYAWLAGPAAGGAGVGTGTDRAKAVQACGGAEAGARPRARGATGEAGGGGGGGGSAGGRTREGAATGSKDAGRGWGGGGSGGYASAGRLRPAVERLLQLLRQLPRTGVSPLEPQLRTLLDSVPAARPSDGQQQQQPARPQAAGKENQEKETKQQDQGSAATKASGSTTAAAAARGEPSAGWQAMRRHARYFLRGQSVMDRAAFMMGSLMGLPCSDMGAAVRERIGPARSCSQALRAAGVLLAADGFAAQEGCGEDEEEVEEGQQGAGGGVGAAARMRLPGVKVCANPGCGNFDEAREELLGFRRCGRCQAVRYCGPACQQQHWLEHKKLCK